MNIYMIWNKESANMKNKPRIGIKLFKLNKGLKILNETWFIINLGKQKKRRKNCGLEKEEKDKGAQDE